MAPVTAMAAFSVVDLGGHVFINEFHYDNEGTDTGEFIEIAGPAGTNLTGWSITRYNGNNGQVYNSPAATETLSSTIPDQNNGFGTVVINYPANGLQNGEPDGFALVDDTGSVVQFLSYEGIFAAIGGPADGMTSTDIGVSESNSTPLGYSLHLTGTGSAYSDFTWAASTANTRGAVNAGQTFTAPSSSEIDLSSYVRIGRYDLPEPTRTTSPDGTSLLAQEVSAVTYNPDTDTLFVVGDGGTSIVQVSKTGQLINSMTLAPGASPQGTEFYDTEGLSYVGNGQFVLIEERDRQASLFTYVAGDTLTRGAVQTVRLGTTVGNIGLEGISADPLTNGFIAVKETAPQGIFQTGIDFVAGTATNGSGTTENSANLLDPALATLADIADVYVLANLQITDNNLLLLSQEDGKVVNIDRSTGDVSSALAIASDPGNPLSVADQGHEGLTMDNNGLLYVVNEQGGGDNDHPQLWVYAPASYVYANAAPVAVSLSNVTSSLAENSDTSAPIKLGTIIISDDALGTNTLSLIGPDAGTFVIVGTGLFLAAGAVLNFETNPSLQVSVTVDDISLGNTPDVSTAFTVEITDTPDTQSPLIISEIAPWSSGNSSIGADWFEVTNTGTTAVDITGWKIDDDSVSFTSGSFLSGITSIAPGQSVVFVDGSAATTAAFVNTWFGGTAPGGFAIGTYGGPGLGTGGDAVNLFDATGTLVTGVTFGPSPSASPYASFDNRAGLPAVSTLSEAGVNGAFSIIDVDVNVAAVLTGSPGTIAGSTVLPTLVGIGATDATAAEANQNPGTFKVLRTGDMSAALAVIYTIGGDAEGTDYTPSIPTTLTIPAGASEATITITPVDDGDAEPAESVTLTLVDTAVYDLAANAATATVTIADNDRAIANFDLQITEIWAGNTVGSNLTADWFEITNKGTDAWVSSEAPPLYYDDDSQDPTTADLINGITRINPGKAVVVVVGNDANAQTFASVWGSVIDLSGVDVGFTDGAGLGANEDAVSLFVGVPGGSDSPVDFETYPAGGAGKSFDVDLMAFSIAGANGAVATQPNNQGQSAVGSPGGILIASGPDVVINEVLASHTGTDNTEYIELFGTPGTALAGFSLIVVEGDSNSTIGSIDRRIDFAATDVLGDNGFLLIGNPAGLVANYGVTPNLTIANDFLENNSLTLALVQTSSLSGSTTVNGSEISIDSVALTDAGAGDTFFFNAPVIGPDGMFFPAGARRVSDGVDTDAVADWLISAFTLGTANTPTSGTFDQGGGGELALISAIQGAGTASPLLSQTLTIEAIVVGDFQGSTGLSGFFLQEEDGDADADPLTSEGIFVFDGATPFVNVNVGDYVRVTGTVTEFFDLTQLTSVSSVVVVSSGNTLPTAATVNFPVTSAADLEAAEGMLVSIPDTLFVTEYFNLDRFGEVRLSSSGPGNVPGTDGRLEQYTQYNTPDVAGYAAYQEQIANRQIVLDDGSNVQNPATLIFGRDGQPLSSTNTLRGGDTVNNLTGILSYGFGDYRIQTTQGVEFQAVNERPASPEEVGGTLKVASLNVLNYFTTIDTIQESSSGLDDPTDNTARGFDPRGADSQLEFERQTAKLVKTVIGLDADILGLVELENDFLPSSSGNAIEYLANQLNAALGTGIYAWVNPGNQFVGGDAIAVGTIYKTGSVSIASGTTVEVLSDADLPGLGLGGLPPVFNGPNTNRAPLAVTFEANGTGERFTLVVNHLKSKGSAGTAGDADLDAMDGAGLANQTRLNGATALNAWLGTDPTGSGDTDVLLVGDLNAYAKEDPITFLEGEGYTDLAKQFIGDSAYSYLFDGQLGTLDYALANSSLISQVTGATEWHINADEPDAFDYNLDFARDPSLFDGTTPFRTSDHDPVIVGLKLGSTPPVADPYPIQAGAVRFATYNASLNRNTAGELINDLSDIATPDPQARAVAEVIQRSHAEVLLINEFDYDPTGEAARLFQQNYLGVSQNGAEPIEYPYIYVAPSNTGVASGFDLNNNGSVRGPDDAFGFGFFEGQYAFAIFSKYPILNDQIRTFQNFLWKDLPGALLPSDPLDADGNGDTANWYTEPELDVLRLSSKNHVDVPIDVNGQIIHVLASHPTPPVFDGPEDRNGKRNFDEIRFWSDYVAGDSYIYDDNGSTGGLKSGVRFVIMGDMNSDPFDGDSIAGAAQQILQNPLVNAAITPSSAGGPDAAVRQGGVNDSHLGNPAYDTADFGFAGAGNPDGPPGNLRADYVLPSKNLSIVDAQVFWQASTDPLFPLAEFPTSDHRLVFVDVDPNHPGANQNRQSVKSYELLGEVSIPTGSVFQGTVIGGLSGIAYDAVEKVYYALSDDRSSGARFYTVGIDLSDGSLDDGDVVVEHVTQLLDANGNPFANGFLDPEGIALASIGTLFISSEGDANQLINPFVRQFSITGRQISELPVPDKYFPTADRSSGIRNNLAFESLTISPDQHYLYTATENALYQDGPASTLHDPSLSRILKYDLSTGQPVAEFVYEVDAVPDQPIPSTSFATNGLVELLALDNNGTFLALERAFSNGVGNTVKLYQVNSQGALDVFSAADLFREESLEADGEIIPPGPFEIDPAVTKIEILDIKADLGIEPDNLEGIALGPVLPDGRQTLIVVSDNNFSSTQKTQFIALALDLKTTPAALPVLETDYTIDDDAVVEGGQLSAPDPVLTGDSDDPAIWVHPTDPARSVVFATLKDGGLVSFDLQGNINETFRPADFGDIRYNNVDLVYGFMGINLAAEFQTDLAVLSDRANDTLVILQIDSETGSIIDITSPDIPETIFGVDDGEATAYGLATYTSPVTGKAYAFVTQASGNLVAQLELIPQIGAAGEFFVSAEVVRTIELPVPSDDPADSQSEGLVVDQELGLLYVALENEVGILRFSAEPGGGSDFTLVQPAGADYLVPDIEGLNIYYGPDGTGYLIVNSQGDSSYAVFSREGTNEYLGSFVVGSNGGIDQVNESDGLDVINVPLGPSFPNGLLVLQDGANDPQNLVEDDEQLENNSTNFKFVPWENVANSFDKPLLVDPSSFDPRNPQPQSLVNGVASGDVNQDSVVLWARSTFLGDVTFEYSTSADFSSTPGITTASVTDITLPVKVVIDQLASGTEYFYRVTDAAGATTSGRFTTAASLGTQTGLSFGVSGDWRGELAPYPAIANVAEKNLDFFIELGDTIYADDASPGLLDANGNPKDQAESVADYRAKHNEVYSSRFGENFWAELRASTPIYATIDDHEVTNDFAGGELIADDSRFLSSFPGDDPNALINDSTLFENGLQVFQEYNPVRDEFYGDTGDELTAGERKLYRYNTFGSDAATFLLDTRSFRDAEIQAPSNPFDPVQVVSTYLATFTPGRTLLGGIQKEELKADLLSAQAAGVTWKFVIVPEPIQNLFPGINTDAWEGYNAERTELLKFIEDNRITNVVFVAADVHMTAVNNLTYQESPFGQQIATGSFEITTGAVAYENPTGRFLAELVTAANPEARAFYNSLPIAPDPDDLPNDKDDFVKAAINSNLLAPLGFDPIGLDDNLPQAEGRIQATLLEGDYYLGHSYSWSEFTIDQETQKLAVTTYGIDGYTEAELLADPEAIAARIPAVLSRFEVLPAGQRIEGVTGSRDNLIGTVGSDEIFGLDGWDTISGGQGDDRIVGGPGVDTLSGDEGRDTFVYEALSDARDQITDFNPAEDKLDFSGITSLPGYGSATPFNSYLELTALTPALTLVKLDPNGDAPNPFNTPMVVLQGVQPGDLNADNFIFA